MQSGTFVADEVLAKHDEKYMPPEVAKSLKRRHGEAREGALSGTQPGARPRDKVIRHGTRAESTQPPSTTSTQAPSHSTTGAQPAGAAGRRTITSEARAFSTPSPAGS